MSMSGDGLVTAIKAIPGINITSDAELKKFCDAIINYIKTNASVTVASGISVATTGSAVAQTGSTTATGTGTVG